ncbi:tail connector protein [Pantoea phage Phynn]|nr:tail connector protein [Pantoea phage Phynn]
MFGYFYHSSLRNYIVLMGQLFNHVQVRRVRNEKISYVKVPITYGSKEKFIAAMDKLNNPLSTEKPAKIETILPRMNLNLVDISYNGTRKTSGLVHEKKSQLIDSNKTIVQFNPVPYRLVFELGVYTRWEDDVFQIVEQILPYFQPYFNCRVTELHEKEIRLDRDIKITIQSVSPDTSFEGEASVRRHIEWSIMFELQGFLYPPSDNMKGEIRTIYTDFVTNTEKELDKDNFESVDLQVDPVDLRLEDWDGTQYKEGRSQNIPIPTGEEPPHIRGKS